MLVKLWILGARHTQGEAHWTRLQERRERHRQNYMHVTIHTSQTWADTFISELNDTHVEAELRTKHIPPQVSRDCFTSCCSCDAASCLVIHYTLYEVQADVSGHDVPAVLCSESGSAKLCNHDWGPDQGYKAAEGPEMRCIGCLMWQMW